MSSRQKQYNELRIKYPKFVYSGCDLYIHEEKLCINYSFSTSGLADFKPHWEITMPSSCFIELNDKQLNELVFSLGMVELISYWKLTCSPDVFIDCGTLSTGQADWWKKLYKKGLGEFFYTNGINADDNFMKIRCSGDFNNNLLKQPVVLADSKTLIPIGGGKDSAVTLELLKGYTDRYCYMINPRKAMIDTVSAAGISSENIIHAKRTLDENMLSLNKQGFLNGHTPFSAIVAFSSVLAAYVNAIKYVALSNESSANEPTVQGSDVNHQYSKSFEFETDFINYEKQYINTGVEYFSLLRPLTEVCIAKIFSKHDKYHSIFQSCNVGSFKNIWCAACPKCLFVYIILSPFLPEEKMINIFSKNMLDDPEMIPILEKLTGQQPEKPFECVGSCDEVNAALQELIRQYEANDTPTPLLLRHYQNAGISKLYGINILCNSFDENNHIPEQFIQSVKSRLIN